MPRPLAILLLLGAINVFAWSIVTPPGQGPDEIGHVAYAQHLAETGDLPSVGQGRHVSSSTAAEAFRRAGLSPLVGNVTARPAWSRTDQEDWTALEAHEPPGANADGSGPNPLAKNPPLYYAAQALVYRLAPSGRFFGRVFWMRDANIVIYLTTLAFTWLLAAELFQRQLLRLVAAGVVALQPQLGFMAAIVNPDNLLTALYTAFMWLAVRTVRRGVTARRGIAMGVVAAGTLLTHGRGIAVVPPLMVALGLALWCHREGLRARAVAGGASVAIAGLGLLALRAITAGSGSGLYGGEVNFGTQQPFRPAQFIDFVWQFYLPRLQSMAPRPGPAYGFRQFWVETFFGSFGNLDVNYPAWVYDLLQLGLVLGAVALYTTCLVRWPALKARLPLAVMLVAAGGSMLALLHLASYRAIIGGSNDPLIVGRYLLPLVGLLGVGVATVVGGLPRRLAPYGAAAVLAVGVLLDLAGLGATLVRFYV